jgi:hypothetical protein
MEGATAAESGIGRDGVMIMPSRSRAARMRRAVPTSTRYCDCGAGPLTCSKAFRIAAARISSMSIIEIFQKTEQLRDNRSLSIAENV